MTISVEQIKKLIDDYYRYESELEEGDYSPVHWGRAGVYRAVINDLEALLPRKSMADIPPEEWSDYVGTWVEYQEKENIVVSFTEDPPVFDLFDPKRNFPHQAPPHELLPLDHPRAWDAVGDPA